MSVTEAHKSDADTEHLFQCQATYYNPVSCKWLEGTFTLQQNYFEFVTNDTEEETRFHLSLPLRTISAIKKRNYYLIYASLVIHVGSETHWFSSFPNRDSIFNLLELFWRNILLTKQNSTISETVNLKTVSPLGKKLLGILQQSEETLVHTAQMLDEQGQQLEEVQQNVADLNSDLSTAEKVLHALPFLSNASQQASLSPGTTSSNDGQKIEYIKKRKYKVTFTNSAKSHENSNEWEKGFLSVADDLKLLDEEENLKIHIPNEELSSIVIVSPWELCINRDDSDDKLSRYHVMCPTLSQLHKVLTSSPIFREKIVHNEDCEDTFHSCSSNSSMSTSSDGGSVSSPARCAPKVSQLTDQIQKAQSSGTLTDEEIVQISLALNNLQTLATEVTKERECQMEKIEQLIDDVNKSDIRINADSKNLRKLN